MYIRLIKTNSRDLFVSMIKANENEVSADCRCEHAHFYFKLAFFHLVMWKFRGKKGSEEFVLR